MLQKSIQCDATSVKVQGATLLITTPKSVTISNQMLEPLLVLDAHYPIALLEEHLLHFSCPQGFSIRDTRSKQLQEIPTGSSVSAIASNGGQTAVGVDSKTPEVRIYDHRNFKSPLAIIQNHDTITCLGYQGQHLVTGDVTGYISTYDLQQPEDDQLLHTITTDSVSRFGVFEDYLWTISHLETFSLHTLDSTLIQKYDVHQELGFLLDCWWDSVNQKLALFSESEGVLRMSNVAIDGIETVSEFSVGTECNGFSYGGNWGVSYGDCHVKVWDFTKA